jgi:hypothetical protein
MTNHNRKVSDRAFSDGHITFFTEVKKGEGTRYVKVIHNFGAHRCAGHARVQQRPNPMA